MEQHISELLKQNQELVLALQRTHGSSQKVTVQFEKFDEENENFDCFFERFQTYLDVQNIPADSRAKVFISSLSAKLYQLLKNLLAPDLPSDQNLDKLKNVLKQHLTPKPLIIPSRRKLLNRKQNEGESINSYIAELGALAINCDYDSNMLNIMLRDVFVSGLRDKAILDRLFDEDNIDLEKTLLIALAMEKACKGANDIMGQGIKAVYAGKKQMNKKSNFVSKQRKPLFCSRCTGTDHVKEKCRYISSICNFCSKVGHIQRACFAAQKSKRKPVKQKQVSFNGKAENKKEIPVFELNSIDSGLHEQPPIMINLKIENKNCTMELDTGGAVCVMSINNFRKISKKQIQPTSVVFRTYKSDSLTPMGVRTVPFALKGRVENEIDRLEKEGIIEKVEHSEWATPVVPVVKPDGSIRLCADYSGTLNPNLIMPQHPLPRLEEIFTSLNGGKQFSKLDFKHAYLQMKVHPESQKLLTINTHKGLYVCKRLMYGLNGEPAIWQRYVDGLFQGMQGVKVFMDDARITGSDEMLHFKALEEFFKKCKEHGLKLNLTTIANPLNNLTKKDVKFKWSKDCQVAFEQIRKEICSPKVLVHYDPELPLTLASDASPVGVGCVLAHIYPDGSERPIAFASKTLSKTEQKYSQIDKEALAIVWAVKKFHLYLKGRRFTLVTDHKPLVAIFGSKRGLPVLTATRLLHYALILQSFQFDIVFRKTADHGNADFLSRLPKTSEELEVKDDITIFQMTQIETSPVTSRELRQETGKDEELGPLLRALREGRNLQGKEAQYTIEDGCILYGQRVCIPKKYQKNVLDELHTGHLGMVKMKALARSFVYWEDIDKDIEDAVRNCVDCARHKTDPAKAKVHYWEYPSMPWERIHIDFAGPIFEHMFLLIVDAHSKWFEVYPMKITTTKKTIECPRDSFARFGLPRVLVSDNGSQFTSYEFQRFMQSNGIKHKTSAPFKPSSNGQAERYVATLKQSLRAMQKYEELKSRVQDRIRKGVFEFRDRKFDIGDKVSVRIYRAANSKWKFGKIVNRDGVLHYTVEVQGTLVRRHVDQIRPVGDHVQENAFILNVHHRFSATGVRESNQNLQHAETAENPSSQVPNKEQGSSSTSAVPSTDVPAHDSPASDVQLDSSQMRSPPVPASPRQVPRRSGRIRRPPKRLVL
ncbi:Transposon Tf2-6 polyprotein [Araneus ventricosus]|uniref:RNA-directed DNA polymerase n=1 Tax=Araneus ventricosus TaxID=182803 RepID=A0A4Y2R0L9_ARAVE|nr:Transposon Tf2-6 polyprotein [Araneus ventricosus]